MTRRDPLQVAKAILENNLAEQEQTASEQEMEMEAMKEAMMKEMSHRDASDEDMEEMMVKMERMSYKEMKEMMKREGVKYETYVSEEVIEDEPEVAKKKADTPDATRAEAESDLETLKGAKKMKKATTTIKPSNASSEMPTDDPSKLPMKEDLDALFNGEELSEDFKEKASVIFESAINYRVNQIREELEEQFTAELEESKDEFRSELTEKLDDYLSYVVEEWMKENKLAVERGIRGDIAESFMTGLKTLFENHYITVPNDKYDLLEGLYGKVDTLENKLNEQIEKNTNLRKEALVSRCINIFTEVAEGLTETEEEKLRSLAEGLEFEDEDQFRDKLSILRENYFGDSGETNGLASEILSESYTEVEEEDDAPTRSVNLSEQMKAYSHMLSRSAYVEKQTKTS
jgi:hypothetical protein